MVVTHFPAYTKLIPHELKTENVKGKVNAFRRQCTGEYLHDPGQRTVF